jgi:Skp family chaperone for outer membrane proteins
MRAGLVLPAALTLASMGGILQAQAPTEASPSPLLTIQRERLFTDTAYGKAVQVRLDEAAQALQTENRRIDADLEAEEKALTEKRATLPPEEFRKLAENFDIKVEGIRQAQEVKGRSLSAERDVEQKRVLETALPILAALMAEKGAVAILDKDVVFLAFDRNDVTDEAIRRIDAELGSGPEPVPAPAP